MYYHYHLILSLSLAIATSFAFINSNFVPLNKTHCIYSLLSHIVQQWISYPNSNIKICRAPSVLTPMHAESINQTLPKTLRNGMQSPLPPIFTQTLNTEQWLLGRNLGKCLSDKTLGGGFSSRWMFMISHLSLEPWALSAFHEPETENNPDQILPSLGIQHPSPEKFQQQTLGKLWLKTKQCGIVNTAFPSFWYEWTLPCLYLDSFENFYPWLDPLSETTHSFPELEA